MGQLTTVNQIQNKIFTVRDTQVMLDRDLAEFYETETKRLNEQVKRNIDRFPDEFRFQLTKKEYEALRSQFATSKSYDGRGGRRYLPYVFTEQGVAMLATALNSKTAVEVSIKIIKSFVQMRRFLSFNAQIFSRLENLEGWQEITDKKIEKLLEALQDKKLKPKQGIFFNGQIFNAHVFISDLIKSAKKSIVLLDNFIDESVLDLFTKRKKKVEVTIYTKNLTSALKLDIEKFNQQHTPIMVKKFKQTHDRFLLIDNKELYHISASLKDLGKKWFAFSKMNSEAGEVLRRLKK